MNVDSTIVANLATVPIQMCYILHVLLGYFFILVLFRIVYRVHLNTQIYVIIDFLGRSAGTYTVPSEL
jgi:hypothetical protein